MWLYVYRVFIRCISWSLIGTYEPEETEKERERKDTR